MDWTRCLCLKLVDVSATPRVHVSGSHRKCTKLPSLHLLLGLNLDSFEYVSSLEHNVVSHFDSVLRFFVSAIRHVQAENRLPDSEGKAVNIRLLFSGSFFRYTQILTQNRALGYTGAMQSTTNIDPHVLASVSLAFQAE